MQNDTQSSYKATFEAKVRDLVAKGDADSVVEFVWREHLQSFRNGLSSDRKGQNTSRDARESS